MFTTYVKKVNPNAAQKVEKIQSGQENQGRIESIESKPDTNSELEQKIQKKKMSMKDKMRILSKAQGTFNSPNIKDEHLDNSEAF